jgi:photosystem II stability/assembly factor-like uncharacterized protein
MQRPCGDKKTIYIRFLEHRADGIESDGGSKMNKSLFNLALAIMCLSAAVYGDTYHAIGLSGGGAIFVPVISPFDKNTMFCGCDMSGYYKTTDGGMNWTVLDYRQISGAKDCYAAFDPTNRNIMFQGSGSTLKTSNDEGNTWTTVRAYVTGTTQESIRRIYVDPFTPSNQYVATLYDDGSSTHMKVYKNAAQCASVNDSELDSYGTKNKDILNFYISPIGSHSVFAATSDNVWRSDDNGATFIKRSPVGPSQLAGFSGGSDGTTTRLFATGTDGKIYVSTSNGDSWTAAPTTGVASLDVGMFNIIECAENNPLIAYAIINNSNPLAGIDQNIYKTADGGSTWNNCFVANSYAWQSGKPPDPAGDNVTLGWQAYDEYGWNSPMLYGFTVCKTDPNYVIGGGDGELYCTSNGGTTWSACYINYKDSGTRGQHKKWQTDGLNVTSTWNYYIDPTDSAKHYICYTDIGFARSVDGGITWIDSWTGSPFANTFYALAFDSKAPGTIYAAGSNSHDIPDGWEAQMFNPNAGGGPVVSTNYGQTWTAMSWTGLTQKVWGSGSAIPYPCTGIASTPDGNTLYIAEYGDGVYKSVKSGGTWGAWTNCNVPIVGNGNNHYYKIVIHKDGTLFVGVCERITYSGGSWNNGNWQTPDAGGLFVSTTSGASWKNIAANVYNGSGLHGQRLYGVDPSDSRIVYLCSTPSRNYGDNGVYKTTNGGTSWTPITPSGVSWAEDITVDPSTPANVYLATNDNGFYSSTNGGAAWTQMSFPFAVGNSIYVDPTNKHLYLCTFGCGVWTNAPGTGTIPAIKGANSTHTPVKVGRSLDAGRYDLRGKKLNGMNNCVAVKNSKLNIQTK